MVTGNFTNGGSGQTGVGILRVTSSPPLPTQISIKPSAGAAYIADSWGINFLELPPGSYTIAYTHVDGFTEPPPQTITITAGAQTTVTGAFVQRGVLRVLTSPGAPATIYLNDIPRNDWGDWTDYPTGTYTVCYGYAIPFSLTPPCVSAIVTAGNTTTVTGNYQ